MTTTRATPAPLEVVELPLEHLHPAPWNANRVPARTLARIRRSIEQFGVVENLVVRPDGDPGEHEVISGNHRLELYADLGLTTAPCHVLELDDTQARLLAQTLNRTRGTDDPEAYAQLLRDILDELGPADITALLPETESSIARLIGDAAQDADLAPLPPPGPPRSRPGELYELGPHRLLCGDATDQATVDELLAGAEPILLVTDPPYGIDLDKHWHDREDARPERRDPRNKRYYTEGRTAKHQTLGMPGDHRSDWSAAFALVPSLQVAYVWHAGQHCDEVGAGLRATGWEIAQQIIWDKGLFALGRNRYHWQHEGCYYAFRIGAEVPWYAPKHVPAFYARKRGSSAPWLGDPAQSTVWQAASPKMPAAHADGDEDETYDHPTQKPVELYARPIRNHLEPGAAIYDPFVGSGTAIIAAELTGRRCYALEIDPAFCDITRQRYATYARRPDLAPDAPPARTRRVPA
jgi:DNA modification methylase